MKGRFYSRRVIFYANLIPYLIFADEIKSYCSEMVQWLLFIPMFAVMIEYFYTDIKKTINDE